MLSQIYFWKIYPPILCVFFLLPIFPFFPLHEKMWNAFSKAFFQGKFFSKNAFQNIYSRTKKERLEGTKKKTNGGERNFLILASNLPDSPTVCGLQA
jgi:hypothetical protein